MKTKVDKFGRVLIPKKVREAAGMTVGIEINVCQDKTGVHLEVVEPASSDEGKVMLVRENGLVSIKGLQPFDIVTEIKASREEYGEKKEGR